VPIEEEESLILYQSTKMIENIDLAPMFIEKGSILSANNNESQFYFLSIYIIVSFYFLIKLIMNFLPLFSSKLIPGKKLDGMKLFFHRDSIGIYSFFNRLYLPIKYQSKKLNSSIKNHELAHYNQFHSLDILIIEISLILFWFNPSIWFLRKEIKRNHEFLADQSVLRGVEVRNYLQIILNEINLKPSPKLGSSFSYLTLKKRINMIQKNKNNKTRNAMIISFGLLISLGSLSLFSFKTVEIDRNINDQLTKKLDINVLDRPSGIPIDLNNIIKTSSEFGMRINPITKEEQLHTGVDLIAKEGTNIVSVGKGKVVKATFSKNYGNHIVIQHNAKYSSSYAHLKRMNVKINDQVELNSIIGIIGNSGKSLKTHLHFELIENGIKIDPELAIGK
jgi:murein DD-endopeptidase MepM/ murein hydrolase activator NlpD